MDSDDESYHNLISTDMLEDISDRSQSHLNVNEIEAHYLKKNNRNGKER